MTLVRRLSLRIAGFVVRHASPGSKEWAEGLAHEVSFIENDWRALAWASGSIRVLLDYRPAAIRTPDDLTAAAEKFAEKRRHAVNNGWLATNLSWLSMLIPVLTTTPDLFRAVDGRHRVGSGMIVIGYLMMVFWAFIRSKEPVVPDRDDVPAIIRFYKEGLAGTSGDCWLVVVGSALISIGYELGSPALWKLLLGVVWLVPTGLVLQKERDNRRKLRQIEALLDE